MAQGRRGRQILRDLNVSRGRRRRMGGRGTRQTLELWIKPSAGILKASRRKAECGLGGLGNHNRALLQTIPLGTWKMPLARTWPVNASNRTPSMISNR